MSAPALAPIEAHPDWKPVRILHRADDSWITFAIKGAAHADGSRPWIEMGGLQSRDLETQFPQFVKALTADSYFSINGMFRATRQRETLRDGKTVPYTSALTDLPMVRRAEDNLRYLNAVYADLDCYGSLGETFGQLISLQEAGKIPPASVLVRSGRGLWALWLLRNPKSELDPNTLGLPQPAFKDKIEKYVRTQRAILDRLKDLGADPMTKDAARCIRIPGSLNTSAPGAPQVQYWIQAKDKDSGFVYTLDELAQWFGVEHQKRQYVFRRSKGGSRSGWLARWRSTLSELETLREIRGGFQKGARRQALFILAACGSKIMEPDALRDAVVELGTNGCLPPIPARFCLSRLANHLQWLKKQRSRFITHAKCAQLVRVTDDEKKFLQRWFPVPQTGSQKIQRRRDSIQHIVKQEQGSGREVPTLREMAVLLRECNIKASIFALSADYKALGISSGSPKSLSLSCYSSTKANKVLKSGQAAILARRALETELVAQIGCVPTCRRMAGLLALRGVAAGRQTICKDYRALGWASSPAEQSAMDHAPSAPKRYAKFSAVPAGQIASQIQSLEVRT